MKFYFAGINMARGAEHYVALGVRHILLSVVDLRNAKGMMNDSVAHKLDRLRALCLNIFLDSGAFTIRQMELYNRTADTKKSVMSLEEYCAFITQYRRHFEMIAALDVIGNAEKSYSNYRYMLKEGLDYVLPAWHCGTPMEYIDKYLSTTDYVAIGGLASMNTVSINDKTRVKAAYIRKALERIKSIDPKTKVHLYGVADFDLLRLFGREVESVDSTKWLNGQRFAKLWDIGARDEREYNGRIVHSPTTSSAYNIYQIVKIVKQINEYVRKG